MKKINPKMLLLTFLIILAVGIFIYVFVLVPGVVGEETVSGVRPGYKIVTDKGNQFSFEIPDSWKVTSESQSDSVLSLFQVQSPDFVLSGNPDVQTSKIESGAAFHCYVFKGTLKENSIPTGEISAQTSMMIDGVKAYYYAYTSPEYKEAGIKEYRLGYAGKVYFFKYVYAQKDTGVYDKTLSGIINSLKINEEIQSKD